MTKAIVMREVARDPDVLDVELDPPRAGEIRVRVAASGVCHSDFHVIERGYAGLRMPVVLGHEASGEVLEVGPKVDDLRPGDHIVLGTFPECGACLYCRSGQPTLCVDGRRTAAGTLPDGTTRLKLDGERVCQQGGLGAWSEEIVISAHQAVKIDREMPLVPAALVGCGVVTGFGAVTHVGGLAAGLTMAVIGCGGLGLNAVQAGRITGAERIVAVDTNATKLNLARELGATDVVDVVDGNPVEQVLELTGGVDVDLCLDFVGSAATARNALSMARRGGTIVVTGLAEPTLEFSATELIRAGRTIKGNLMGMASFKTQFPLLIDLYKSGALKLDELVSQRLVFESVGVALQAMRDGTVARSVLIPA